MRGARLSLDERWRRDLAELRSQRRYRELQPPAGVDLTSNDYLGHGARPLPDDPPPLPRSGLSARLLRGQHPAWDDVEAQLAQWHGTEACLMMTSGYAANEGLLACAITPNDWVASDELNHASIIDGLRLTRAARFIYRHQDLNQLADGLRTASASRSNSRQLFIVTESFFGMEGDVTPLRELVELAERFEAHVLIDEAHATGCFGPSGAGLIEELGLRERVLASVHTGGKALGVAGAYIAGSSLLRELLINRCRHFIFTTALPPQLAAWWSLALPRVRSDAEGRRRLHANAASFRGELLRHGIRAGGSSYIVPILVGPDDLAVAAARRLQEQGWDIRAIRPPSVPEGTARLRVSIHADHEPRELIKVAVAIAEALA